MVIKAISDLHGDLPEITDCDVLLVAGDICPDHPAGKRERYGLPDYGSDFQLAWLDQEFRAWLHDLSERGIRVVGIAGNHDFVFEKMPAAVGRLFLPWIYLKDDQAVIGKAKIWGTPWVPGLPRWAFHGSDRMLEARMGLVPPWINILMPHGPPYGTADFVAPQFGSTHVGDRALAKWLDAYEKPPIVVCGHIHEQYGIHLTASGATVYNVSHNDERYGPRKRPAVTIWGDW